MLERDRLAQNLFEIDTLRSPIGLAVLRDMLDLYQKSSNVEYRPGLEPDKCPCGKGNGSSYDWRHVNTCFKAAMAKVYGFAELCFLCNEWFHCTEAWDADCQHHMDHLDRLPVWCDPLTYGGVLARAGYCPFCLGDRNLPVSVRMHQFKIPWTWLDHIQTYIRTLEGGYMPVHCPILHPTCLGVFQSIQEPQCHLQDAFGVERNRDSTKIKRPRYESDDIPPPKRKRPQRCRDDLEEDDIMALANTQYRFTNVTMDSLNREKQLPRISPDHSQSSTPSWGSNAIPADDEPLSGYSTPLSSIVSEEVIDPTMFVTESRPDDKPMVSTATKPPSEAMQVVFNDTQSASPS
ncbi:hypothetical protein FOZG_17912 [Fusarium oxysporum Fo47]|uniref:Uncharacterized protein n=1 Tax=Fusarium oxysporum Fo47 TaxID=660027 RepID=W9J8Q8_FUSOX|nr:hypothetical protein FOZG_17912 [Fusarium oxysporum Fo47]